LTDRPLTVVVVEDQPLARSHMAEVLGRIDGVRVAAQCADGPAAVDVIPKVAPDLVFLDIQMPGMTGFDVIEAIGVDCMPAVVFVTAYDMYALKAFEVQALDYVLKPTSRARLEEAVGRARQRLGSVLPGVVARHLSALLSRPEVSAGRDRFAIRSGGRIVFVRYEDVDWVEACGNYAILHVGPDQHTLREPMTALEERLGADFKRIHRGTIVNLRRVRELRTAGKGEYDVILRDGRPQRVTRRFRRALESALSALD
jgi:two-component system LytT family response regulator